MEPKELQNYTNHAKLDPPFHFFLMPVAAINVIIAVVYLFRFPGLGSGWILVVALAFLVMVGRMRAYGTHLQDRIIRVEERLRLSQVLAEPLRARIGELSDKQLVGLRFASDGELPALVQRALDEKLSLADIKKSVTNWRGDYSRI
jgi:Family of unknown function (DUF6526)